MHAEIIAIGDELTSGQRLDTNSQWASRRLGDLGLRVLFHTTVADDLHAIETALRQAAQRVELLVITGGLGPTADDLTRHAIAAAAGSELELDKSVLAHIRSIFARRHREMPVRNEVQAMFPVGSRVIPNPNGTAPGIDVDLSVGSGKSARLFALPGVPAEMREMWHATVAPELERMLGERRRVIRHRRIKCFGVGESDLEAMLPDLIRRGRSPAVGITVHRGTITLRITAEGENEDACLRLMEPTIETIHECLGTLVFGEEDDELEHVVTQLLAQRPSSLATVEWGTGGVLAAWLHAADDPLHNYRGGLVIRSVEALCRTLDLPRGLVDRHGTASAEVTSEMAARVRELLGADYGLAVSDFPDSTSNTAAESRFHVALSDAEATQVKSHIFAGHPDIVIQRSAKQALNLVRLRLANE